MSKDGTWEEHVAGYLGTLNASTATQYRMGLRDFAAWYRGSFGEEPQPELLTDEEVRKWRGYLSGVRKLAASTVNARLAAVKGLARFCGRTIEVKGVKKVEPPIDPLSARELGRLVAAVEDHRWGPPWLSLRNSAMVSLMARAGLRVGEVAALDVGDVELGERSGWVMVRQGKGLKERRCPLSLQARRRLAAYLEARPEWTEGEALFVTRTGQRVIEGDVQRVVAAAAQRAGIARPVTPHLLRHTFSTRFLRKGGDLATLRSVLGHASIVTTGRYLHPDAARVQEMVEGL